MKDWGEYIGSALSKLLREARLERRITMEELAMRAGLDRTYIGMIERGERRPTVPAASSIAASLGLSIGDVLALAERQASDDESTLPHGLPDVELVRRPQKRTVDDAGLVDSDRLTQLTGLSSRVLATAIESAYHTLDLIDDQLTGKGSEPLSGLVELANLSSIFGNLLAAGVAESSDGLYRRNGPHKYPDLLATSPPSVHIEIKTALEGNRPKGHLPKPGAYLTFRYVLTDRDGTYTRGKAHRGEMVKVWEARFGVLDVDDFSSSSTLGDSGKTAVIRTPSFTGMHVVYFDRSACPSPSLLRSVG